MAASQMAKTCTPLDSRSTAEVEDGASIKSGGAVKVSSTSEVDATTKAIGLALSQGGSDKEGSKDSGDTTGVAAGLSVNVGIVHNDARIGDGAEVHGDGITVEAVTPVGKSNDVIAWGIAGAGSQQKGSSGSSTAVAGGIAVNVVTMETTAEIAKSADVQSDDYLTVTARGDVGVQAIGAAGAAAIGGSSGGGKAVGAAVAVNVILNDTTATIGDAKVDAQGAIKVESEASTTPLGLVKLPQVFNPTTGTGEGDNTVDTTHETLLLDDAQFANGDSVKYLSGDASNSAIGGLDDGKEYFVRIEGDGGKKISLFDSEDHAKAGAVTFEGGTKDAVDLEHNTIVHGTTAFTTGDEVIYRKGTGANTAIEGLTDNQPYFVRLVDDKLALYHSKADALADSGRIDLTKPRVNSGQR